MTPITVALVAPQGCDATATVMRELSPLLTSDDEVIFVEYDASGCAEQVTRRHISGSTANEMTLRRLSFTLASHDVVLVIEDHTLPTPQALLAARSLGTSHEPFLVYYLRNGSTGSLGSRAFYRFIHSSADVSLWPEPPGLVPSVFAAYRPAVQTLIGRPLDELMDGELEMTLLPAGPPTTRSPSSPDIVIEHHQAIGLPTAIIAVYSNARVVAATPVQQHRTSARGDRFRAVWNSAPIRERPVLLALLAATLTGTAVGRLAGLGSAPQRLARAHPVVSKFKHSSKG